MRQALERMFHDRAADALNQVTLLQIIPDLRRETADRMVLEIANALTKAGGKALVASEGGPMVSELQANGGIWIPFPTRTKNPLAMALNIRRLAHLIEAEEVDIVHARSRAPAWVAFGAANLMKTPFVTSFHEGREKTGVLNLRYNSVMARGDSIIADSYYAAGQIAKLYPQAKGQVSIIPPGADLKLFSSYGFNPARVESLRRQWNVTPDERIVLLPGRFRNGEGQRLLIEAARQLLADGLTDVKFILSGDNDGRGACTREIRKLIENLHLQKFIFRTPTPSDLPAALLAAAIVVLPATHLEAAGRTAIEAQAMGTPVIVSNLGTLPESILAPPAVDARARTGWCVPPNDAIALASAIATALGLGASAKEAMSGRARAHVERHFNHAQACAETLKLYKELLCQAE
jgi:glycosyltransferase involved in cell wall biosynthesis